MSIHRRILLVAAMLGFAISRICSAPAARVAKLSDVVSADDIVAEISAMVAEIDRGLESSESYRPLSSKLRRSAWQLAMFFQTLAEHDEDSKFKSVGPSLRNAALSFGEAKSYDAAREHFGKMKVAMERNVESKSADVPYDWKTLASLHELMEAMRERTDRVRKALRRPNDPVSESRNAAIMAILAVAIDTHGDKVKPSENEPAWHAFSLELQRSMTKTARAILHRDRDAALTFFTAAHAACTQCHEKFKL